MLSSRLFVSLTRRLVTHRVRAPAFADRARVAVAVTAAAVAAAASAASVPSIAEGDEFARWAADLRGRPNLAGREVDLLVQGPHEVGRLALAAHRVREATMGGRQFIWEICRDGDHRIKQVAVWRWLERDDLLDAMMETAATTTTTNSATTTTAAATATATATAATATAAIAALSRVVVARVGLAPPVAAVAATAAAAVAGSVDDCLREDSRQMRCRHGRR